MTRSNSPTPEAIIIDNTETSLSLNHATQFNNLQDMLEDGVKPTMVAKFTALLNMLAKVIKKKMSRKITTLSSITAEVINETIDQIREDITGSGLRLQTSLER